MLECRTRSFQSLNLEGYAEGFSVKCLSDRVLPTVRDDAAQSPILQCDTAEAQAAQERAHL